MNRSKGEAGLSTKRNDSATETSQPAIRIASRWQVYGRRGGLLERTARVRGDMLRSARPCPAVGTRETATRAHRQPRRRNQRHRSRESAANRLPFPLVVATLAGADGPERRTRHDLAANLWVAFRLPHGLGRTIGLDSPQERI